MSAKTKSSTPRVCQSCNSVLTVPRIRSCEQCKSKKVAERKETRKAAKLIELQKKVSESNDELTIVTNPDTGKSRLVKVKPAAVKKTRNSKSKAKPKQKTGRISNIILQESEQENSDNE